MEWRGILCSLFFILSMGESSSRFRLMWLPNLVAVVDDAENTFTWPILSASVFVLVAILLPMYLIFEHLASYNQPEVCYFWLICLNSKLGYYTLKTWLSFFLFTGTEISYWTYSHGPCLCPGIGIWLIYSVLISCFWVVHIFFSYDFVFLGASFCLCWIQKQLSTARWFVIVMKLLLSTALRDIWLLA